MASASCRERCSVSLKAEERSCRARSALRAFLPRTTMKSEMAVKLVSETAGETPIGANAGRKKAAATTSASAMAARLGNDPQNQELKATAPHAATKGVGVAQ